MKALLLISVFILLASPHFCQEIHTATSKKIKPAVSSCPVNINKSTVNLGARAYLPGGTISQKDALLAQPNSELLNFNGFTYFTDCQCDYLENGVLVETLRDTTGSIWVSNGTELQITLTSGLFLDKINIYSWNSGVLASYLIDLNPSTTPYLTGCGGSIAASDLIYDGSNDTDFENGYNKLLENAICNLSIQGANSINFRVIGNRVRVHSKRSHLPTNGTIGFDYNNHPSNLVGNNSGTSISATNFLGSISSGNNCVNNRFAIANYTGGFGSSNLLLGAGRATFSGYYSDLIEFSEFYEIKLNNSPLEIPNSNPATSNNVTKLTLNSPSSCIREDITWQHMTNSGQWANYAFGFDRPFMYASGGTWRAKVNCGGSICYTNQITVP